MLSLKKKKRLKLPHGQSCPTVPYFPYYPDLFLLHHEVNKLYPTKTSLFFAILILSCRTVKHEPQIFHIQKNDFMYLTLLRSKQHDLNVYFILNKKVESFRVIISCDVVEPEQ